MREWCHHMRTNRLIHQVCTWLTSHPYTIYIAGFWFHVNVRALQRCLSTICWPTLLASSFTQPSEIFSNNHGSFTHTMCNLQRQTQELQLAAIQTQKHNHPKGLFSLVSMKNAEQLNNNRKANKCNVFWFSKKLHFNSICLELYIHQNAMSFPCVFLHNSSLIKC